jgi:hypothetical protein
VLQQLLRPLLLLASSSNIKQPVDMHDTATAVRSQPVQSPIQPVSR